jgi:hydroxymethylpyrimidine/phosphomethylpyrimidine kinase
MKGRILIVAGSDSGGGAGIQADIKTVTALGGFATTAITALTAQNTCEVRDVLPVPPAFVRAQMEAVLDDIGADVVKTGMLFDAAVIESVSTVLEQRCASTPLVVDPVMVAERGARLLAPAAVDALRRRLIPLASVITPNLPEAEVLLETAIADVEAARQAAARLQRRFGVAVLLKGGHFSGEQVMDVLVTADGRESLFRDPRLPGRSTHGTGCTLASAIAAGLAQGLGLEDAVARGRRYLREAIGTAAPLGRGHGPLNHGCRWDSA